MAAYLKISKSLLPSYMKFALITEGPSEHRVIKHIVSKYFKEHEPDVNQIQPKLIDNKQDQSTPGGWPEVLKYCERTELKDIFVENDYLIIQIDSDQSQTATFGVSHSKANNQSKSIDELHQDIVSKLKSLIKPEILAQYGDKIFFAICVHTIECWLLPIYYVGKKKINPNNCGKFLNAELRTRNIHIIPSDDKNGFNARNSYTGILNNWKRKKDITDSAKYDTAFKLFVDSLGAIEPV